MLTLQLNKTVANTVNLEIDLVGVCCLDLCVASSWDERIVTVMSQ